MNQAIIVNKKSGYTSRDVINKLNKILNTKKIGHTGTLDPMASGVLVCLVGKYTKLAHLITSEDKEYNATIKLGVFTDTLDITGTVLKTEDITSLDKNEIINVLNSFIGEYKQTIPIYSAKHVNGKRLYEYARNNEDVELPENIVNIKEIELLEYNNDLITFRVLVSKGTYIRSLIQSICEKLNVIGTMTSLKRTKQGKFDIKDSFTLEEIEEYKYKALKITDVMDVSIIELNNDLYKNIINGNKIEYDLDGYILFKKDNKEIALYYFENKIGRLKILINEELL